MARAEEILLLGDQLFASYEGPGRHALLPGMPQGVPVVMAEDVGLATRIKHHKQKVVLFFSAMRHYRDAFRAEGREVTYQEWAPDSKSLLETVTAPKVYIYQIADRFFEQQVIDWASATGRELVWVPNPMFLTSAEQWSKYLQQPISWPHDPSLSATKLGRKRLLMGDFYKEQRQNLNVLLEEDGSPVGGKWSFDADNRLALPKNVLPPPVKFPAPDTITREVVDLVEKEFADHPGSAKEFAYAVTLAEVEDLLQEFLHERLDRFGEYEDAIPHRERTLFHSILTPYLNCGLLTPARVVEATLQQAKHNNIPLNSLEGFLRQVIGWREFIFWMDRTYLARGVFEGGKTPNHFGHTRKLGPQWYRGDTGLPPLDTVILRTVRHAWCHHIERLMVVGSAMLMAELHPDEAYRWFMEMFIDSADWVMSPNVYGMSQFADGGMFATKPYLSGSAYILKMSDYGKGPWCDVWDGLYWRFIAGHLETFAKNPRMAVMLGTVDKMDPARKERIFTAAERWIDSVTIPG